MLEGKRVVVTGGTGSLGQALVRRLLTGTERPQRVIVFSRDEAKQHDMRTAWTQPETRDAGDRLEFKIGDIRDYEALLPVVREADVVFHAAALKQIPSCEYVPVEAVKTNVVATDNLVRAIYAGSSVEVAVAISTDKACKPVNVMGMTKAIQERIFIAANLGQTRTRFVCVRYGNVVSSRGSVVPLFAQQIRAGGPVTLTAPEMTRFLLTLDRAVDAVLETARSAQAGEVYVPRLPTASVAEILKVMLGDREISTETIGVRPGEKVHEVLISDEEAARTVERGEYFVIRPLLPELTGSREIAPTRRSEYSSREVTLDSLTLSRMIDEALAGGGNSSGS